MKRDSNKLNTKEAIELANSFGESPTRQTIINWCEDYNIGSKVGGQWRINKKRLKLLLQGKTWQSSEKKSTKNQNKK